MTIYRLWNDGLGDHWASLNLLAHMSVWANGREIGYTLDPLHVDRAREILAELNLPYAANLIRHANPEPLDVKSLDGFHVWSTPYFPTHKRWIDKKAERYVCTHFDGVSSAAEKNPSAQEQEAIIQWATRRGLCVINLGGKFRLELSGITDLLSRCALFVGCDSGMSHIAHSVSCPTYILEYGLPVVTCHRHKRYVLCKGAEHFKAQADNWMNWLEFMHSQK